MYYSTYLLPQGAKNFYHVLLIFSFCRKRRELKILNINFYGNRWVIKIFYNNFHHVLFKHVFITKMYLFFLGNFEEEKINCLLHRPAHYSN